MVEIDDHAAAARSCCGRKGVAVVRGVHCRRQLGADVPLRREQGHRVIPGRRRLGALVHLEVVGEPRTGEHGRRVDRIERHYPQYAVIGRAGAVQVQVREALDVVVAGPIAAVMEEIGRAIGPAGVGAHLGETARRRCASKAAPVGEAEAVATRGRPGVARGSRDLRRPGVGGAAGGEHGDGRERGGDWQRGAFHGEDRSGATRAGQPGGHPAPARPAGGERVGESHKCIKRPRRRS